MGKLTINIMPPAMATWAHLTPELTIFLSNGWMSSTASHAMTKNNLRGTRNEIPGALVVGDNKGVYYSNLDEWKADLKNQAAAFAAQPPAADTTASPAAAATVADSQTVNAPPMTANKPLTAGLPTMGNASVTGASVALQVLLYAQQHAGKSAATGLASKFGATAFYHFGLHSAAALQATSSQATSARSDNHLNEVA